MTVFEFRYSSCIHEGAMATYSLHKTEKGAIKAMKAHKAKLKKEYKELYPNKKDRMFPFGVHADWDVIETEVLE